jgi:hypothetical protein
MVGADLVSGFFVALLFADRGAIVALAAVAGFATGFLPARDVRRPAEPGHPDDLPRRTRCCARGEPDTVFGTLLGGVIVAATARTSPAR